MKIGLIGGSGIGDAILGDVQGVRVEVDTPFGPPSDAIIEAEWSGIRLAVLSRHGPGHLFNPSQVPYRANIFALKSIGCTHLLATGAVGGLREEYQPRDLVIVDQVIDKTYRREPTFFDRAAVHVELGEPFCPSLRQVLLDAGTALGTGEAPVKVHSNGCYVCMEGPAFSTRAESLMHRLWGGDVIGMTAMPEAKLAREAEMSYALVALVTDYDSWRQKPPVQAPEGEEQPADSFVLIQEIVANLKASGENAARLIRAAIERIARDPEAVRCVAAHEALQQGIWSSKDRIDVEEVRRLWPIWGRHFDASLAPSGVEARE